MTPSFPVVPGRSVLITASTDSFVAVPDIIIEVDGQTLALDSRNRAEFVPSQSGKFFVTATATDINGNVGQAEAIVKVRSGTDTQPPQVEIDSSIEGTRLTSLTQVRGSVTDANLDRWELAVARVGAEFKTVASGVASIADSVIATLDPANFSNGIYRMQLSAVDFDGRKSTDEILLELNTEIKPQRFLLTQTDVVTTIAGETLRIERQYDSLEQGVSGKFGNGWRWTEGEMRIETDLALSGREAFGSFTAYEVGTRLYLTLPEGRRVGFTFLPKRESGGQVNVYRPQWVADSGVSHQLESADALLNLAGNRLYELASGRPYNPADSRFSGAFELIAPDGTRYRLDAQGNTRRLTMPSGTSFVVADSGIILSGTQRLDFIRSEAGGIAQVTSPNGESVHYAYERSGNLSTVYESGSTELQRFEYETASTGRLALVQDGASGTQIQYLPTGPVTSNSEFLGTANRFIGGPVTAQIDAGQVRRYTFAIADTEIRSTQASEVLVGINVSRSGGALTPAIPRLDGVTPVASNATATEAFALFAIDQAGLRMLSIEGADIDTSGAFTAEIFIAGDVNSDGRVDANDSQLLAGALGSSSGDANYQVAIDSNRDGIIDASDVQILNANLQFAANLAPTLDSDSKLTHENLEVVFPVSDLADDVDGDAVFLSILSSIGGTATLVDSGSSLRFVPAVGFVGDAAVELRATDGYSLSDSSTVTVNVSDSPLLGLDFVERSPTLYSGRSYGVELLGDFADQDSVQLPPSYFTLTSSVPEVFSINPGGFGTADERGSSVLVAEANGLRTATVVNVVPSAEHLTSRGFGTLDVYPLAVSLPNDGTTRQILTTTNQTFVTPEVPENVVYVVGDPSVVEVSPDGVITSKDPGETDITVIVEGVEQVIQVSVLEPVAGPATLDAGGGIVRGSDGSLIQIPAGAIGTPTVVSIAPVQEAELPF
ncbi:Ig-like domain-containing protein, partial [Stieleria sp.]|uniref:Ig-like domain-containing protein n=1 Tax=Stieleria sp. TaxID=2795976 RepID=UPI0035699632